MYKVGYVTTLISIDIVIRPCRNARLMIDGNVGTSSHCYTYIYVSYVSTIEMNNIGKLSKDCRSIWNELNGGRYIYSQNYLGFMRYARLMMNRNVSTLLRCYKYICVVSLAIDN